MRYNLACCCGAAGAGGGAAAAGGSDSFGARWLKPWPGRTPTWRVSGSRPDGVRGGASGLEGLSRCSRIFGCRNRLQVLHELSLCTRGRIQFSWSKLYTHISHRGMRRVYGSRSAMQRCTDLGCPSLSRRDRSTHCPRHGGDGELEVACCLRQARGSRRRQANMATPRQRPTLTAGPHSQAACSAPASRSPSVPGSSNRRPACALQPARRPVARSTRLPAAPLPARLPRPPSSPTSPVSFASCVVRWAGVEGRLFREVGQGRVRARERVGRRDGGDSRDDREDALSRVRIVVVHTRMALPSCSTSSSPSRT